MPRDLTDELPLHPRVLAVLLALSEGAMHGYALLKRLAERSEAGPKPGPTTLYRTLHDLEDRRLIEPTEDRPDPLLDDERRTYYRLTAAGRAVLEAEVLRLERVVAWARGGRVAESG